MSLTPTTAPIPDVDGLVHPEDESAVINAVRFAREHGLQIRTRGAGHSPPDGFARDKPQDLVLSLDRMRELTVVDAEQMIVRAQAGIHLGPDPEAAGDSGKPENSLLHRLALQHGCTVSTTGGITHQTLGGFLATCSSGGTVEHSFLDHVIGVRLIDGTGEAREFTAEDTEGPGLAGLLPSLGLLGVIVAVTLRCEPIFVIAGQEAIVDLEQAGVDLDGPGDDDRPSLADFLIDNEYARIQWWPQRGAERLLIWQAQRGKVQAGFTPTRYEEFTRYPILAQALFSSIYVIFGNGNAPERIKWLLKRNADEVREVFRDLQEQGRISGARRLVPWSTLAVIRTLGFIAPLLKWLRTPLRRSLPWLVPTAIGVLLPLDTKKPGMRRGEPQSFHDWSWEGLPMDNQADDVLLWSQFTELWVPIRRAQEMVTAVRSYFGDPSDTVESYKRTGLYAYELYAGKPAIGWMHPAYTTGADEWAEGAVRLDVFWFTDNLEDPRERFYPQFWDLMKHHGIPFRCHWGKEVPTESSMVSVHYPRWHDWLALRAQLDPDGVFLTNYWRVRLGLPVDADAPV